MVAYTLCKYVRFERETKKQKNINTFHAYTSSYKLDQVQHE